MYSDFEKAFDKVSHDRLIYKLKLYGFSKDIRPITWIQDFLKVLQPPVSTLLGFRLALRS